jgi:hypothetical protein
MCLWISSIKRTGPLRLSGPVFLHFFKLFHVILSGAKNLYYKMRDSSVAEERSLRVTRF